VTFRGIMLGFALGLLIAGYTYFNDHVAQQGQFIGSFMPIALFGAAVLIVLLGNPLLQCLPGGRMLSAAELAVAIAIGSAVCGFTGSNFLRYFTSLVSQPAQIERTNAAWQGHNVFSYLPGAAPYLAAGQVRDWPELIDRVADPDDPLHILVERAGPTDRAVWRNASAGRVERGRIVRAVNHVLSDPAFAGMADDAPPHEVVAVSRDRLHRLGGELFTPPPTGGGVLLLDGRTDPVVTEPLVLGSSADEGWFGEVPWSAWRRPIALWVALVLMLALASLGLALIFHPQWSRRELLPYPVARVISDLGRRTGERGLPDLARTPMFWVAFAVPFTIHLINGFHAWFPNLPEFPLRLDFNGLRGLFPNASRSAQAHAVFHPLIVPSMVAFGFLLSRSVSFTLGISNVVFVAVGALFIVNGMEMEYNKFTPNKNNLLRLGAFLGLAVMMFYAGRRYYWHVMVSAVSLRRFADTPRSATWGARCCGALLVLSIALLSTAGIAWWLAAVLVALSLLIWVVIARVVAETGMILMAGPFLPLGVLPALLGPEALGPTGLILLGIAGAMLVIDPKEAVLPFLVNGLQMGEKTGVDVGRLSKPIAVMMIVGMAVAVFVTLSLQYRFGINHGDGYAASRVPSSGFNEAVRAIDELTARGTLAETVARTPTGKLLAVRPDPAAVGWFVVGLVLVIATGLLTLRVPRWPIHPVLFIVWGVWGIAQLGFSIFLGWLLNFTITRMAGMRGYRAAQPAVFGVIAGELTIGLAWMVVAAIYFSVTGQVPPSFRIFP